jgi:hypothetical protein
MKTLKKYWRLILLTSTLLWLPHSGLLLEKSFPVDVIAQQLAQQLVELLLLRSF